MRYEEKQIKNYIKICHSIFMAWPGKDVDVLASGSFWFLFVRRYASAGNSDRNVSVCPSVCQRAGIVSK